MALIGGRTCVFDLACKTGIFEAFRWSGTVYFSDDCLFKVDINEGFLWPFNKDLDFPAFNGIKKLVAFWTLAFGFEFGGQGKWCKFSTGATDWCMWITDVFVTIGGDGT